MLRLLTFGFLYLLSTCVPAQPYGPATGEFSADAHWLIPPGDASAQNQWLEWKTSVELAAVPATVATRIAVDSKYWLWINDALVVFEGQLKRGPTPSATYFDTLDLATYLRAGTNHVYLLHWYWGKEGFSHKNSGLAGMLFDAPALPYLDWQVRRHPAYTTTSAPHPNYRLPEFNVGYDARDTVGAWAGPQVNALPGEGPWGQLWKRPFPRWADSGLVAYERLETEENDTATFVRAYLPRNLTITPYFDISAPAGGLIDLRTDNYRGGGAPNVRGEYTSRDGRQQFEQLAYMNGHWVEYTFPAGTEVHRLAYRETRYPANYVGHFSCDDEDLNILWEKSLNTLNVDIRDVIADCPDRERAQWWGDVVINFEELFYAADTTGLPIIRKAFSNLVEWQRADSSLYAPVPAGNWHNELPTQMLASISSLPLYFRYTADTALLRYAYPSFKAYLDLWCLREDGLVEQRQGGWTWLDWGNNLDSTALYNVWYHKALTGMAEVEEVLGVESDLPVLIERHRTAVNTLLWTAEGYRSPGKEGPLDDRPQGIAVVAGLAEAGHHATLIEALEVQPYHASPYSEKYLLEALFELGQDSLALQRMSGRYRKMIDHPWITTLWEGWGLGAEGFGGGTYNHAWSGGPLTLLSKYVAGVRPATAGYGSFLVAPQPGHLRRVTATVPSIRGVFTVHYTIDGGGVMDFHLSVPEGLAGHIVLPEEYVITQVNYDRRSAVREGANRLVVGTQDPRAYHLRAVRVR